MGGIGAQAHLFKKTFRTLAKETIFAGNDPMPTNYYGHPGAERPDDIILWQGLRSTAAPAALGPQRPREETIELDAFISVYRGGGVEAEEAAADAAYGYLSQLEEFCRITDTTIGGTVKWCFLDRHDSDGWTIGDPAEGRNITILATFVAQYRITSN